LSYPKPSTERPAAVGAEPADIRPSREVEGRAVPHSVGGDAFVIGCLVALGAVFYLAPWPLIYLPALLGVGVLTWRRPDLALVLVPLFSPFYMEPKQFGHPRP
jgi:hypothetical protein